MHTYLCWDEAVLVSAMQGMHTSIICTPTPHTTPQKSRILHYFIFLRVECCTFV
jgi:hypothetical protein